MEKFYYYSSLDSCRINRQWNPTSHWLKMRNVTTTGQIEARDQNAGDPP